MSANEDDYELLDFGGGRKLERLGGVVVDRPCPAAARLERGDETLWKNASIRYHQAAQASAGWAFLGVDEAELGAWRYRHGSPFAMQLALAPLPSGQVGVFPEQSDNWAWIFEQVIRRKIRSKKRLRVLNLFAYTGASTIAAAAGGAEVTHVDAVQGSVDRASGNAAASGLADASIRWIVDDAMKFCRREVRRQNRYDAVILDPPTYGHGKRGQTWQFKRDLPELLRILAELTDRARAFILLTSHTTGIDEDHLAWYLTESQLNCNPGQVDRGEMRLLTSDNRDLASGVYARWTA